MSQSLSRTELASSLRSRIGAELKRLNDCSETLQSRSPLLRGSLYVQRVNCGKPTCRACKQGPGHRRWMLSRQEGGKTVLYKVRPSERAGVEELVTQWRMCRTAMREMRESASRLAAAARSLVELRESNPLERVGAKHRTERSR